MFEHLRVTTTVACLTLLVVSTIAAANEPASPSATPKIDIYVTPYYGELLGSTPNPKINVGSWSKDLAGATDETILDVAKRMKADWATLPVETMYVTAIRLFNLGHPDEAVRWYYAANTRHRVFLSILDEKAIGSIGSPAFELKHAFNSFHQLAGPTVLRYAFEDLDKFKAAIDHVQSDDVMPEFDTIYRRVKFLSKDQWETKRTEVRDGLAKLKTYLEDQPDEIREKLKEAKARDRE